MKKKFTKGVSFKKVFSVFVIGCVFGSIYERLLHLSLHHKYESRDTLIYGPFNKVYGLGAAALVLCLGKENEKRSFLKTFLYASLIGGLVEYLEGIKLDKIFNVEFWNYDDKFLNVQGKTTIPYMIVWGLMGAFFMKKVYPQISKSIENLPLKPTNIIYYFLLTFILFDNFITYSSLYRRKLRNENINPKTLIGEVYDKYYTDEFFKERFPVMNFTK